MMISDILTVLALLQNKKRQAVVRKHASDTEVKLSYKQLEYLGNLVEADKNRAEKEEKDGQ